MKKITQATFILIIFIASLLLSSCCDNYPSPTIIKATVKHKSDSTLMINAKLEIYVEQCIKKYPKIYIFRTKTDSNGILYDSVERKINSIYKIKIQNSTDSNAYYSEQIGDLGTIYL